MEIVQKIRTLILPVLDELGFELVELALQGSARNQVLRIYIDTETGVSIEECQQASQAISDVLDTEDIIPNRYRLEVSSPGVHRPLKSERDFKRNINRQVRVNYQTAGINRNTIQGIIDSVVDGKLMLKVENQLVEIPIHAIDTAKIVLKW